MELFELYDDWYVFIKDRIEINSLKSRKVENAADHSC